MFEYVKEQINFLLNRIVNLITHAYLSSIDDSQKFQFAKIKRLGAQKQTVQVLSPYGLLSYPPPGSLGTIFTARGQSSSAMGIFDFPDGRKKNLNSGEAGIQNYLTGTYILLDKNGNVVIVSKNNVSVTTTGDTEINTTGATSVSSTGAIDLTSDEKISMKAPEIDITTDTLSGTAYTEDGTVTSTIAGSISADGDITSGGDITDGDNIILGSHLHSDVESGSDNTGTPTMG